MVESIRVRSAYLEYDLLSVEDVRMGVVYESS